MFVFRTSGLLLVACLMTACGKREAVSAPAPTAEKKTHPWDLVPEDPDLLAGRKTYLAECAICHNEGEEDAPALTEHEEWSARMSKPLELLFEHAINGFIGDDGEMPARGGTETLTDTEVQNAVRYMLTTQNQS